MDVRYRAVALGKTGLTVLIVAVLFALAGVVLGVPFLAILLGALCATYGALWWLTEKSESRFGRGYRHWREERENKPIRTRQDMPSIATWESGAKPLGARLDRREITAHIAHGASHLGDGTAKPDAGPLESVRIDLRDDHRPLTEDCGKV